MTPHVSPPPGYSQKTADLRERWMEPEEDRGMNELDIQEMSDDYEEDRRRGRMTGEW